MASGSTKAPARSGQPPVTVEVASVAAPSNSRGTAAGVSAAGALSKGVATLDLARCIRVRGAKEHNLKNIDVDIPRDRLVVMTGLSGSGKSSLAFDTIFAEGQRKYMESLSAYARQFLDQLKKPDVEDIQGLPPTIAIEQRSSGHNPRSTVATSTEIYDYLRLLFARCGSPTCWHPTKVKKDGTVVERCGKPIQATAATQIVDAVLAGAERAKAPLRALVLAPVVRAQKGFHKDTIEDLQKQGWGRARVNGSLVEIREVLKEGGENPLKLARYEKHDVDAVIDRLTLAPESRQRLAESVEAALRLADGTVVISTEDAADTWTDRVFSDRFACAVHPECALSEMSPRLFSFNSPQGACPECHGLGVIMEFSEELIIPKPEKSLAEGAVVPWRVPPPMGRIYRKRLRLFCEHFGVSASSPVSALSEEQRQILIYGTTPAQEKKFGAKFDGVAKGLRAWYEKTESAWMREWLGQFMQERSCPTCRGDRLRIESLSVGLASDTGAHNIAGMTRLNIRDCTDFIAGLRLTGEQTKIAEPVIKEIAARLKFLSSVGLEYLSLDRRTSTLSGGEAQRIRLATQVGSGLVGACYVLDEPTIGLHQRDNDRLIGTLRHLTDIGNTVLVVEHDEDMIRRADYVVDVGPGPGVHGGRIVAAGSVPDLIAEPASLTGRYLAGIKRIETPAPAQRRRVSEKRALVVKGARQNNLKGIDATIPLGGFVCITGVSGSGKSTLVNDILLTALKRELHGTKDRVGLHDKITGTKLVDRVIEVDQSPIGRTPRSNPATYTGMFDDIRKVFTETKESKVRGYKPGRFSFNVTAKHGGGRCEACEGQGLKRIEMHFLPDVYVNCEVCDGRRYNRETLEVKYRGKSIADVLDMTVEAGVAFFENHGKIVRHLLALRDVGLDYITLGQPSTQLSGGEAQRVKLATELAKGVGIVEATATAVGDTAAKDDGRTVGRPNRATGEGSPPAPVNREHTLYVLDEPTTGLHFEDIRKLVGVLNRLADAGNTLVVIEHNLDVIKCADWLIDLGPEGGDDGGRIVAAGTPEQVAKVKESYTGRYLGPMLRR